MFEHYWCGGFGSPQLSSSPKTPTSTQPTAPHATTPTFPEAPAEAVTVGPLVDNFLWSAGNNLTWGLDSMENRASAHLQTEPLSLALPSRTKHQLLQRRSIIWMSHYSTVEAWNVLKIKVFLLLYVLGLLYSSFLFRNTNKLIFLLQQEKQAKHLHNYLLMTVKRKPSAAQIAQVSSAQQINC